MHKFTYFEGLIDMCLFLLVNASNSGSIVLLNYEIYHKFEDYLVSNWTEI